MKAKTGMQLLTSCAVILTVAGAADSLDIRIQSLDVDTSDGLVELVLGRPEPIWKFEGSQIVSDDEVLRKEARLIYPPFQSSDQFCRTYVTTIRSPAWFCEEECTVRKDRTYHIQTKALVAPLSSVEGGDCTHADLENDFFSLEVNLHDKEVRKYLDLFEIYYQKWQEQQSGSEAVGVPSVSQSDLESVNILTQGDVAIVRFIFRHPQFADAGHRIIFDLRFRGTGVVGYDLKERMP